MDTQAARRARQQAIKQDLANAYTDEEACPPEWVDLLDQTREASRSITDEVIAETSRFASDPDIRTALARRDRFAARTRERIEKVNAQVRRLNLIAPNARFTRGTLDADEILRPLYRTQRQRTP
jgi:hypothetical protein